MNNCFWVQPCHLQTLLILQNLRWKSRYDLKKGIRNNSLYKQTNSPHQYCLVKPPFNLSPIKNPNRQQSCLFRLRRFFSHFFFLLLNYLQFLFSFSRIFLFFFFLFKFSGLSLQLAFSKQSFSLSKLFFLFLSNQSFSIKRVFFYLVLFKVFQCLMKKLKKLLKRRHAFDFS